MCGNRFREARGVDHGGRAVMRLEKWAAAAFLAGCVLLRAVASERLEFDLSQSGTFTVERGHGYDLGTRPAGANPFYYSVKVPEGTWRVTVLLGAPDRAGARTVRAESRRWMAGAVRTEPGARIAGAY